MVLLSVVASSPCLAVLSSWQAWGLDVLGLASRAPAQRHVTKREIRESATR